MKAHCFPLLSLVLCSCYLDIGKTMSEPYKFACLNSIGKTSVREWRRGSQIWYLRKCFLTRYICVSDLGISVQKWYCSYYWLLSAFACSKSSLEVFKNQCNFPKFLMLNSGFDFFRKIHSKIFRKDFSLLFCQTIRHIMETFNEIT